MKLDELYQYLLKEQTEIDPPAEPKPEVVIEQDPGYRERIPDHAGYPNLKHMDTYSVHSFRGIIEKLVAAINDMHGRLVRVERESGAVQEE